MRKCYATQNTMYPANDYSRGGLPLTECCVTFDTPTRSPVYQTGPNCVLPSVSSTRCRSSAWMIPTSCSLSLMTDRLSMFGLARATRVISARLSVVTDARKVANDDVADHDVFQPVKFMSVGDRFTSAGQLATQLIGRTPEFPLFARLLARRTFVGL